jgi:hypothetical protein
MRKRCALTLITMALLVAAGCGKFQLRWPTFQKPVPVEEVVEAAQWSPYPIDAEHGDDWDILVRQGKISLQLVNRTARTYDNMRLWLNQQFVTDVASIAIGPGNSVPLASFVNVHGETYPVGGFLTPDKAFPVLAVELFDPADGKRHRLNAQR